MDEHALIPHPYNPPAAAQAMTVSLGREGDVLSLEYRVTGGPLELPSSTAAVRTDELWKRTCFELFLRPDGGDAYIEFNFSPSGAWAAYTFDGYRAGMRPLALEEEPTVTWSDDRARVRCVLPGVREAAAMALTAVIRERDGPTSYWSLAHPVGPPDFHDAACFAGRLPEQVAA